jgi:WD40 repeat protein
MPIGGTMKAKNLGVLMVALLILAGAACVSSIVSVKPDQIKQAVSFEDETYFHNADIAWDGQEYFTLNGGNEEYGQVSEFSPDGERVNSADVSIDGRAIFYCPTDKKLYIKSYSLDLHSYDPDAEEVELVKSDVFRDEQGSPALSPDGKTMYELSDGTLYVMSFPAMKVLRKVENFSTLGSPHNSVIAASRQHLFVWDDAGVVSVYDLKGKFQSSFELGDGLYSMSLTWANGMLWAAEDADGKTDGAVGTWHGYTLGPGVK